MDRPQEIAAFKHAPLQSPRSFRVLILLPSNNFNSVVRCEIRECSLDDQVKYEALSYVWGEPALGHTILVGGKALGVTPNCLEAMRYLRPRRWRAGRVIWIDAVCIDQDSSEKNHQVQLMGEIYSKAANVLAWIGPSDATTARTIRRLKLIGWIDEIYNQARNEMILPPGLVTKTALRELSWQLSEATVCYQLNDEDSKSKAAFFISGEAAQAVLVATFHLLAKNPLDKIYGLYAILSQCGLPLADPDYSKAPEQLYEETMWTWIESRKDLSILQIAACREPVEGLPSWVPAWHKPRDTCEDRDFSWEANKDRIRPNQYAGSPNFYATHSPGTLRLRGRHLGVISFDGSCARDELVCEPDDVETKTYQMWCREVWKRSLVADLGHFDSMLKDMFETLVDRHLIRYESDISDFRRWFEIMIYPEGSPGPWTSELPAELLSAGDRVALAIRELPRPSTESKTNWIADYNALIFFISYRRRVEHNKPGGRFFFILDTGMMGMARPWFQAGDELFLFPGSDCPFVLRRDGNSHRLIAPAHMARVRDMELRDFDGMDLQDVTLI